jgi:hypothetical protein
MVKMAKLSTGKVFQKHERCFVPLPICTRKRYDATSLVLLDHLLETVEASFIRLRNGEAERNPNTRMTVQTCTWLTFPAALPIKSTKSRTEILSRPARTSRHYPLRKNLRFMQEPSPFTSPIDNELALPQVETTTTTTTKWSSARQSLSNRNRTQTQQGQAMLRPRFSPAASTSLKQQYMPPQNNYNY